MTQVRCSSCHREERWDPPTHHVVIPGGLRRPSEALPLAAWRVFLRSFAGELGPVVGVCAGCGMPLTAEPGTSLTPWSWSFDLPDGPVIAEGGRLSPALSATDLTRRLEALHHKPWRATPALWLFQGTLLSGMAVPAFLWVSGMIFVGFFLANYWKS